jgi:sec-independent protein translocase protein TatA
MPFNLGIGEVLIILVIVLLLFGAKRIPEIAGSLGKGINSFKRNLSDVDRSLRDAEPEFRRELDQRPAAPVASDADTDRPEPKRLLS